MRLESMYGTWIHDFSSTSRSTHVDYTTESTIRIPLYIPGRISFFFLSHFVTDLYFKVSVLSGMSFA